MEWIYELLGISREPQDMTVLQVCMRAFVTFFAALVIVRLANRRFLSKMSPLDVILGFVLASMLARAINGSGPLVPSIVAGFLLVMLHRGLAALSCRWDFLGKLVKGEPHVLVENGKVIAPALLEHNISKRDLDEALRMNGGVERVEDVKRAMLERDGDVSVIKKKD